MHKYKQENNKHGYGNEEKDLTVIVDHEFNMIQKFALLAKRKEKELIAH